MSMRFLPCSSSAGWHCTWWHAQKRSSSQRTSRWRMLHFNINDGFLRWGIPILDGLWWKIPSRNGCIILPKVVENPAGERGWREARPGHWRNNLYNCFCIVWVFFNQESSNFIASPRFKLKNGGTRRVAYFIYLRCCRTRIASYILQPKRYWGIMNFEQTGSRDV